MIQIVAAFALVGVIGGGIIWWGYHELAKGIKGI